MKQSFKYNKKIITNLMSSKLGVINVDINSDYELEETINNIIRYISLEKLIRAEGTEYYGTADFNLEAIGDLSFSEFQNAIIKFQQFIESTYQKPLQIIEELNQILKSFPKDYNQFVSRTFDEEYLVKLNHDSTNYWYFKKVLTYEFAEEVYEYFMKLGYKSESHVGINIYLHAEPKAIDKSIKKGWKNFM